MNILKVWAASSLLLALGACGGDDAPSDATGAAGAGNGAGGAGGQAAPCSTAPKTHVELINACTDAQAIEVHPVLPLLQPDGSLPPLP
ncbi:MAG: hypothetical protein IT374_01945 [Polyangiaceae bacterium]|nr:hypothetical protein [Polyangiaceae bacterium]